MNDRDILKTVVGLKAGADLNAIRAHLDRQEAAAKAAEMREAHANTLSSLSHHYGFVVEEIHKRFLNQLEYGKSWFSINYAVHGIIAGGLLVFMAKEGAFTQVDDFSTAWALRLFGLCLVGYLVWAYFAVRQKQLGLTFMFGSIWNGDAKHDLENSEIRELAERILRRGAESNFLFAFNLHTIARKNPLYTDLEIMHRQSEAS